MKTFDDLRRMIDVGKHTGGDFEKGFTSGAKAMYQIINGHSNAALVLKPEEKGDEVIITNGDWWRFKQCEYDSCTVCNNDTQMKCAEIFRRKQVAIAMKAEEEGKTINATNKERIEKERDAGRPCGNMFCGLWIDRNDAQNCDGESNGEPSVVSCKKYLPMGYKIIHPSPTAVKVEEEACSHCGNAADGCHVVLIDRCYHPDCNKWLKSRRGKE